MASRFVGLRWRAAAPMLQLRLATPARPLAAAHFSVFAGARPLSSRTPLRPWFTGLQAQQRVWASGERDQPPAAEDGDCAKLPTLPPVAPLSLDATREQQQADAFKLEKDTWAERYCPAWMVPYVQLARLNRPAGTPLRP